MKTTEGGNDNWWVYEGYDKPREMSQYSGQILKIEAEKSVIVHFLASQPIGAMEHRLKFKPFNVTCLAGNPWNEMCPLCEKQKKTTYQGYFPVLDMTDNKVKLLKRGVRDIRALESMHEDAPLDRTAYKIKRTGSGLQDTVYQFIPLPNKVTTPEMLAKGAEIDLHARLRPKRRSEILEILENKGTPTEKEPVVNYDDDEDETTDMSSEGYGTEDGEEYDPFKID